MRGPAGLNAGTAGDIGAYEATSTYQVTSTNDSSAAIGTLRSAVSWADNNQNFNPASIAKPAPNTIVFLTTQPTTITLGSGALLLSNTTISTAIDGPGALVLTISGGGASQVFQVASGVSASISGMTITGGSAVAIGALTGSGGGIDNSGTLVLTGDALTNNSAINGGGLANEAGGLATVNSSTIANNSATTGGGIYNAGTLTIVDSTVALNSASGQGGGVANFGALTAVSTTIAQNSVAAGGSGGGIDNVILNLAENVVGTVTLYDTIVAQNTVATNPATFNDIAGTVVPASSNNLIGSAGSGGLTSANSNLIVGDGAAGLGSLAGNGGSTQTIALLAGSPAVGAGSTTIAGVTVPTVDQRGNARPAAGIDIGAFQTPVFMAVSGGSIFLPVDELTTKTIAGPVVLVVTPPSVTLAPPAADPPGKVKVIAAAKKAHPGAAQQPNSTSWPKSPRRAFTLHPPRDTRPPTRRRNDRATSRESSRARGGKTGPGSVDPSPVRVIEQLLQTSTERGWQAGWPGGVKKADADHVEDVNDKLSP